MNQEFHVLDATAKGLNPGTGRSTWILVIVVGVVFTSLAIYSFMTWGEALPPPMQNTVLVDCVWAEDASAWLDTNGNGRREPGEGGLPGVRFTIQEQGGTGRRVPESFLSDNNGAARLHVFLGGCPEVHFEVHAEPPTGYIGSTPGTVSGKGPLGFGFRRKTARAG
jgi:hypothetical protein